MGIGHGHFDPERSITEFAMTFFPRIAGDAEPREPPSRLNGLPCARRPLRHRQRHHGLADIFCERLSNQLFNELREIVEVLEAEVANCNGSQEVCAVVLLSIKRKE